MRKPSLKLAYFLAVMNATIIGFSFLMTKVAIDRAHPLDTLAFRFALSFAAMSVPAAFGWVKLNYRGKPVGRLLLLSALYPLGFFTLQAYGLRYATSAEGGILYAFTPAMTTILASLILKERTSSLQKLSIFLSAFGVVFIFAMKDGGVAWSNMTGIALLLLTCIAFAGYGVFARSLSKQFNPAEVTYLILGVGFVSFLAASLVRHATSGTLERFAAPLADPSFLLSILFLGVLATLSSALTANYLLSKMEASKASVFNNLATVVSVAAGAMFLGEKVTAYHVIGSALIIAGVIGTHRLGTKPSGSASLPIRHDRRNLSG
ncbi:DMT family transporter [Cohnella suwonensis]|uniref:DMT family transporter n=1 Tax=Cohnella suwonensis TaxID=696072 RepID=A0ABW0LWL6_9BACL